MAQILDPLPPDSTDPMLCCYVNATSKVQVARIANIPNWYFERVVFPGQRLMFETLPGALLEIHTGMMASAILSDTIPCDRLRMEQEPDVSVEAHQDPERHPVKHKHKQEVVHNNREITEPFNQTVREFPVPFWTSNESKAMTPKISSKQEKVAQVEIPFQTTDNKIFV